VTCSFEWVTVWTFLGASATCVLAGTAVCALNAAKGQIAAMREVAAFQMLSDVFKVGVDKENIKIVNGKSENITNNPSYKQYITLLLLSCEKILAVTSKNSKLVRYEHFVKDNLQSHKTFLSEENGSFDNSKWEKYYDKALVEIMRSVVEEQKSNA
jgi:hypothetical protein